MKRLRPWLIFGTIGLLIGYFAGYWIIRTYHCIAISRKDTGEHMAYIPIDGRDGYGPAIHNFLGRTSRHVYYPIIVLELHIRDAF